MKCKATLSLLIIENHERWCDNIGGRGTYASGNNVAYKYEAVDSFEGVKILQGIKGTGLHDLPAEAHSSNMYMKLHSDGTMNMLRIYGKDHYLKAEIGYHSEPQLTGNYKPVLHIHYYDKNFNRTDAAYLDDDTLKKYKKYMKGR